MRPEQPHHSLARRPPPSKGETFDAHPHSGWLIALRASRSGQAHEPEFKEGSGAADRVSRPFAREVGPRLQEAHAQRGMAVPVWRRGSPRLAVRLREASGHLRGRSGAPWNASLPIWRYHRSGRLLQPASPRFARAATACGTSFKRRQSAVPRVRAMPCWRACGPARWGKRSSYGNGFAIFSRYITEPRDLASESSRPMPDIRLFALARAIIST